MSCKQGLDRSWIIWEYRLKQRVCSEFIHCFLDEFTRSWHTHRAIRLDELERQECVSEICVETVVELLIIVFEHLICLPQTDLLE